MRLAPAKGSCAIAAQWTNTALIDEARCAKISHVNRCERLSISIRPCERGSAGISVFTVEQRNALRERVLRLGEADVRVVAGAVVGSLAVNGGDRFSDIDLTFAIADHVPVTDVLADWTTRLIGELDAVWLTDLERGATVYRVFLLPDALQLDLSMTPAAVSSRWSALPARLRRDGPRRPRDWPVGGIGVHPHARSRGRPVRVGHHL